jgi:hypothetical protein
MPTIYEITITASDGAETPGRVRISHAGEDLLLSLPEAHRLGEQLVSSTEYVDGLGS